MKNPHCKISGHDHSGPCTECPECCKIAPYGAGKSLPVDVPNDPFDVVEARQKIAEVILRLDDIENRLDAIDSRRKYQREYMRKKRGKK